MHNCTQSANADNRHDCESREEWLQFRRRGIGASDAAAVLNLSPWKSSFAVWAEKTGEIPHSEPTEPMRWGTLLEPIVRWEFQRVTGLAIEYDGPFSIHIHPEHDWMLASLDGRVEPRAVYEGKTANDRTLAEWEYQPPLHYQVQTQHQLAVTGRSLAHVAVLIGGQTFKHFEVPRNDKFIAILMERLERFWESVKTQTPPKVDGSEATKKAIALLHPLDNGETVTLPDVFARKAQRLARLKAAVKHCDGKIQEIDNQLRAAIGDATYGETDDASVRFSLKAQTRAAHQVKESTFRVLRQLKGKTE